MLMRDELFERKYHNFKSDLLNSDYNFKLLDDIHNYLFDFHTTYCDVRMSLDELDKLSNYINDFFLSNQCSIDELLKLLAIIRLYQPFYDGNRRTCFLLMKYFFDKNNIPFSPEFDKNSPDLVIKFVPLIYDENEEISSEYKKRVLSSIKNN